MEETTRKEEMGTETTMKEAIFFDAEEKGISTEYPDPEDILKDSEKIDADMKALYTGGNVSKKQRKTAVYVQNTELAEKLCDEIFTMTSVSTLLLQGKSDEDHLPVNLESGDYLTMGEYVRLFDCSPCKIIGTEDRKFVEVVNWLETRSKEELGDMYDAVYQSYQETVDESIATLFDEDGNLAVYVTSIFISECLIMQEFSDGSATYTIIKERIPAEVMVLEV